MKLDPTQVFYLKHRDQIEEWVQIRKQLSNSANSFFASITQDIAALAPSLNGKPRVETETSKTYRYGLLFLPDWPGEDGDPLVAIGLQWCRKSAMFDRAYVGVWCEEDAENGSDLHRRIKGALGKAGILEDEEWDQDKSWPAWKYVKPIASEYWSDLDSFRDQLLESVRSVWADCAPVLTNLFAKS